MVLEDCDWVVKSLIVVALMTPVLEATVPDKVTLSPTLIVVGDEVVGVVVTPNVLNKEDKLAGKAIPPPTLAFVVSTAKFMPNTDTVRLFPLTACTCP
jgi:hypothetical protein